jgi:hypothetical protein
MLNGSKLIKSLAPKEKLQTFNYEKTFTRMTAMLSHNLIGTSVSTIRNYSHFEETNT